MTLLMGALVITSCGEDDNNDNTSVTKTVADGVYVVNEGSYYLNINGSIDFLDYATSSVTRKFFQTANGRSLGSTPNNAVINGEDEMYIATTDENRVEIANAKTLKSVAVVNMRQPRELAYDDNYVYVSSYTGRVYKIDDKSHEVVDSSEVIGANLEGIAVVNGNVYVCNSWNPDYSYNKTVVKLDTELNKKKDITVVTNPTSIVTNGSDIFVVSQGNYKDIAASVQRIDASTDEVTEIGQATMAACTADRLYLVNAPYGAVPTYSYYTMTSKTTQKWMDGTEVFSPFAMGVDPLTDDVFITSLSQDPDTGYANYSGDGYLVRYKADGTFVGKYVCGVNPGTIVFINHTEVDEK